MARVFVFCLVCLWSVVGGATAEKPSYHAAVEILRAQIPKFQWQEDTAVTIDIDGDGVKDVAVLGYTKDTAAVGVVFGSSAKGKPVTTYLDFSRDGESVQRGMTGPTATLYVTKQDDTSDATGALPEGYEICDKCYEIDVVGDHDGDPLHIYWDKVTHALNWWRG